MRRSWGIYKPLLVICGSIALLLPCGFTGCPQGHHSMSRGRSGGQGSGGRGGSTGGQGMMHDVKLRSLERTLARMNNIKEAHNVGLDEAMMAVKLDDPAQDEKKQECRQVMKHRYRMAEGRANAGQKHRGESEDDDAWKRVFDDIGTKTEVREEEEEEEEEAGGEGRAAVSGDWRDRGAPQDGSEGQLGDPGSAEVPREEGQREESETVVREGEFFHQVMADLKSRGVKVLTRSGDTWGGGKSSGYRWEDGKTKFRIFVPIPEGLAGRDIVCSFNASYLTVGFKGRTPLMQGRMYGNISTEDSVWEVEQALWYNEEVRCACITLVKLRDEAWLRPLLCKSSIDYVSAEMAGEMEKGGGRLVGFGSAVMVGRMEQRSRCKWDWDEGSFSFDDGPTQPRAGSDGADNKGLRGGGDDAGDDTAKDSWDDDDDDAAKDSWDDDDDDAAKDSWDDDEGSSTSIYSEPPPKVNVGGRRGGAEDGEVLSFIKEMDRDREKDRKRKAKMGDLRRQGTYCGEGWGKSEEGGEGKNEEDECSASIDELADLVTEKEEQQYDRANGDPGMFAKTVDADACTKQSPSLDFAVDYDEGSVFARVKLPDQARRDLTSPPLSDESDE